MKRNEGLRLVVGAVLLAVALYALVSAPGVIIDRDSTVPLHAVREAVRLPVF